MKIGVDPKVDYAFKWLFGNEQNAHILIHLLHAILNLAPGERIAEIQILNPFNDRMALDEKLSVLDVKARDQRGRQFNVEMQMLATPSLKERILYYWAKLYAEPLQAGDKYDLLQPTISVCFVDEVLFPDISEYHLEFRLVDTIQQVRLTDDLWIHFFELPKFRLGLEALSSPLETWLYFLQHAEGLDTEAIPAPLANPAMRQAMEVLVTLTEIDIQKEIYEGRLKRRRDEQMWRSDALKMGRAEGRAEGILIGRIEFAQTLLHRDVTPREDLEAMSLESLQELASQLEQELMASQ